MKKILITGENGYIATSLKLWLEKKEDYRVDLLNVRNYEWANESFKGYHTIIHTAALVHSKNGKEEYQKVNVELTLQLSRKAKEDKVRQFIFLSTMGVYDQKQDFIDENTELNPQTFYALSKYQAEIVLNKERTKEFKIAILRPPLVYGYNAPGNYKKLSKLASITPIFPKINNKRSMIFIDNLTEFIQLAIDKCLNGLFFPQNKNYVNTTELVTFISKVKGNNIKKTVLFNWIINFSTSFPGPLNKIFGSFAYDKKLPGGPESFIENKLLKYETVSSLEESIRKSEIDKVD